MGSLFPTFSVASTLAEGAVAVEKYKSAPFFDLEKGEFKVDGGGKMLYGTGYDAWVLWCTKTVETQRLAHAAYSSFIGTEWVEAFAEPDRAAQESALERTISEALLADPQGRTVRVYDFVFLSLGDSISASFQVLGAQGETASITVQI